MQTRNKRNTNSDLTKSSRWLIWLGAFLFIRVLWLIQLVGQLAVGQLGTFLFWQLNYAKKGTSLTDSKGDLGKRWAYLFIKGTKRET